MFILIRHLLCHIRVCVCHVYDSVGREWNIIINGALHELVKNVPGLARWRDTFMYCLLEFKFILIFRCGRVPFLAGTDNFKLGDIYRIYLSS